MSEKKQRPAKFSCYHDSDSGAVSVTMNSEMIFELLEETGFQGPFVCMLGRQEAVELAEKIQRVKARAIIHPAMIAFARNIEVPPWDRPERSERSERSEESGLELGFNPNSKRNLSEVPATILPRN